MAPVLEVDIDALNADGGRLESLGKPVKKSNCAPPGADSTSLGAARALNEHELALIDILEYATRVREYGGGVIKSAAVVFELTDEAGATSIHRVDKTSAPPISSSGPPQMPALPPVPHQPPIASIPELPALPSIGGEQFSADLHSGPGPSDLRDFSRAWHHNSQDITRTADDTRSVGAKVNEHWSSGDKAENNIMDHAKYLDSAAAWAERLSVAAEAVARAFDTAKQDCPTPDEFSDAESDVMEAAALVAVSPAIGMIEYRQATSRYAELVAKAEETAKQYHTSVGDALTALGNPMVPCPPIASRADIPAPLAAGSALPPPGVPPGWIARPADNGMGTVYQQPGAVGNSNSIRIMEPGADPRSPYGYVRFTNEHNQPINLDGKPGTRAETHIPRNPDGSFPIPRGWP
ncbi:PPE domain-containing protein [Mycobacterium sp. 3519A]|uniref:PPE domain-containing protein n=1 Tax=Mycobacterium sp. 3519A TaxID=2057184 RepID=UPI000C7C5F15|nr:PPE domain-containing protein [Mycobacterium sp. 3519A]